MNKIGTLNNRNIFYQRYEPKISWAEPFPNENWLVIIIVTGCPKEILFDISEKILNKNVCFVCCAGDQAELLHDMVDDDIIVRQLGINNIPSLKNHIMTTWHDNISNGLWYAIYTADNDAVVISTVIYLDAGENDSALDAAQLIEWFGDGYIPQD